MPPQRPGEAVGRAKLRVPDDPTEAAEREPERLVGDRREATGEVAGSRRPRVVADRRLVPGVDRTAGRRLREPAGRRQQSGRRSRDRTPQTSRLRRPTMVTPRRERPAGCRTRTERAARRPTLASARRDRPSGSRPPSRGLVDGRVDADRRVVARPRQQGLEIQQDGALLPPAVEKVRVLAVLQLDRLLELVSTLVGAGFEGNTDGTSRVEATMLCVSVNGKVIT
jgi:hypothetical protein